MATALMVTFVQFGYLENGSATPVSISTQTLTFVDVGPAQKALDAIILAHEPRGIEVTGVILKDVVI